MNNQDLFTGSIIIDEPPELAPEELKKLRQEVISIFRSRPGHGVVPIFIISGKCNELE